MILYPVTEKTTARYTGKLVDESQAPVDAGVLTTFILTLSDDNTGTILNGRDHQNTLNLNGVSIDSLGNIVWLIDQADNVIIGTGEYESHTALFEWTYASGTKGGKHEVGLAVQNLRRVT